MEATRVLREEHQTILRVLGVFETALDQCRASNPISSDTFEPFIDFFRGFVDRCHHCKEEDRLFPCLVSQGLPSDHGPIAVMLEEHAAGRGLVRTLAECLAGASNGDSVAGQAFFRAGRDLIVLLRDHITKEDHVLFELADEAIQGQALTDLTRRYQAAESEPDYAAEHERCGAFAGRCSAACRTAERLPHV